MIEYKELSAMPYNLFENVKSKRKIDESVRAYSAELHTTSRGIENLCVCFYEGIGSMIEIRERYFINSLGDFRADYYNGNDFIKSECSVATYGLFGRHYDSWNITYNLVRERIGSDWIAIENADEIILDFANRHFSKIKPDDGHKFTRGICWVAFYQQHIKKQKEILAEKKRKIKSENRMKNIGEVPQEFFDWAYNSVLNIAPWFYRYDRKKSQKGVCGACKKEGILEKVKDNTERICPKCGRTVTLFNIGRKRCTGASQRKTATAIYVEQHGDEFISRFFFVEKSYRYEDETTSNENKSFKVMQHKDAREYRRTFWRPSNKRLVEKDHYFYRSYSKEWDRIPPKRAELDNELGPIYPGNIIEITQAIGLPGLKNMDLRAVCEFNASRTPAHVFNAVLDCPAIEGMAKLGLKNLTRHYLEMSRYETFMLEGSPAKIMKIGKDVLAEFAKIDATYGQLVFWRDNNMKMSEIEDFKTFCALYRTKISEIGSIMSDNGISLKSAMNYIEKQKALKLSLTNILMYWKDYLRTAKLLNIDLSSHNAKYPKNIRDEHDRVSTLYEISKNQALETSLQKRFELLDKLTYSDDDFVIKPLRTVDEFVHESTVLSHCVKTYVSRCAAGETNIFALRKKDSPDVPYFTVNINNKGELIQNRGKNNCAPPKEVNSFVRTWLKIISKTLKTMSIDKYAASSENNINVEQKARTA